MRARKNNGKKLAIVLLSVILVLCCTIGGTLAWLQDSTATVTNTFTVGDVDIEISETGATADGTNLKKDSYKILPGTSEEKDPKVTVKADSEACWVFVKIVEKNNYIKNSEGNYTTNTYIGWSADTTKWTLLSRSPDKDGAETVTYVYYIEQAATTQDVPYAVLTNNKVTYSSELTKAQLDALGDTKPTLSFTAYAIQQTSGNDTTFAVAEAWAELNKS